MPSVDEAIDRGLTYVRLGQDADGLWHDPEFPVDEGSDWVTAFVAKSFWVLMAANPEVRNLEDPIERAHQALSRRQRSNGGWAYSAEAPTDAEATAWALWSLLDEPRRRLYSTGRGRRYLSAHRDPDSGGYRPYASDTDDAEGRPFQVPPAWRRPQPCVTGVSVRVLAAQDTTDPAIAAACDYLKRTQDVDGLWRSDLWFGAGAPTLVALGALHAGGALDVVTLSVARDGLAALITDAHDFELASALTIAPRLGLADVGEAVDRLIGEQGPDGTWTPRRPVRASIAIVGDSSGQAAASSRVIPERSSRGRLLTTATALAALGLQQ